MAQAMSISDKIFERWCEKLRKNKTIPNALIETIQKLYQQGKLSDPKELEGLLVQAKETNNDKN